MLYTSSYSPLSHSRGPTLPKPTKLYRRVRQRHWGKWVPEIRLPKNRTRLWLSTFDTVEEAFLAFDKAAYKLKGDFTRLNFLHLWHHGSCLTSEYKPLHSSIDAKLQAIYQSLADNNEKQGKVGKSSSTVGAKKRSSSLAARAKLEIDWASIL